MKHLGIPIKLFLKILRIFPSIIGRYEQVSFKADINLDKAFKNGPSKICGKQPLKILKRYGLLKQTISHQIF